MKPLTPREIRVWNAWELFTECVSSRISHEVAEATGLSAADYRILSCLVDRGHGQLRQRELATALAWDKSRISHQLTRMQERDLLKRTKTAERGIERRDYDGRARRSRKRSANSCPLGAPLSHRTADAGPGGRDPRYRRRREGRRKHHRRWLSRQFAGNCIFAFANHPSHRY